MELRRRARKHGDPRAVGLIAFSIGKLLHGGEQLLRLESNDEFDSMLGGHSSKFMITHQHSWRDRREEELDGVLVYLRTPVHEAHENIWNWARFITVDLTRSQHRGEHRFAVALAEKLDHQVRSNGGR